MRSCKLIHTGLFILLFIVPSSVLSDLLCRNCGNVITTARSLRNVKSDEALYSYNASILNVDTLVQVFQNPVPETFHVITASGADLKFLKKSYSEDTWFPGMRWTTCVCSKCETHMGWYFESANDEFVGLVLDYMISAEYADALTIVARP